MKNLKPRIIGGITLFAVLILSISSIPLPPDENQLQIQADFLNIEVEEMLDGATSQLVFTDAFDSPPDLVIEEIEFRFDEQDLTEVQVKPLNLVRTITFDDGTEDTSTIPTVTLESLNFLAIAEDSRPLNNGKIKFSLEMPIDETKTVRQIEGDFSIGLDDMVVKSIFTKLKLSDIVDNNAVLLSTELNLNTLLNSKSVGLHTLNVRLDKLFVIYEDESREYSNPNQELYTIQFEKNDQKTIKKDEHGQFVKVFDFDVPITVSANTQSVSVSVCLSKCWSGGCCQTYTYSVGAYSGGIIPAPALGVVTITDISTGEVVASKPASGAGYCSGQGFGYPIISGVTQCRAVSGGGGSLGFSAQRGESYRVTVSDPSASWVIDVPETGGAYNYSCVQNAQNGVRSCNFP